METRKLMAVVCAMAMLVVYFAQATDLYWSGNGTTIGGAGNWDTSTTQWGSSYSGPFSSIWNNSSTDTARFSGTAGTVTNATGITVGGLWFDTTGYVVTNTTTLTFAAANNTITLNNIAAATINGPVGGSGNVILTAVNPSTAGTLTLNGTSTGG
jgi:fibronectin-binding autotransporter adhesin